jgi:hypothetical protein
MQENYLNTAVRTVSFPGSFIFLDWHRFTLSNRDRTTPYTTSTITIILRTAFLSKFLRHKSINLNLHTKKMHVELRNKKQLIKWWWNWLLESIAPIFHAPVKSFTFPWSTKKLCTKKPRVKCWCNWLQVASCLYIQFHKRC